MSSKTIQVEIPVKNYVYKFLSRHTNLPVLLTLNNNFGVFVYHMLRRQKENKKFDKITEKFESKVPIDIPDHMVFNDGVRHITSLTANYFNTVIENEAKREFYYYLNFNQLILRSTRISITQEWMRVYDITEDDISMDALWKAAERIEDSDRGALNPLFWKNQNSSEARTYSRNYERKAS